MSELLLKFDIRVMYNQYKNNETDTYYYVKEFVDPNLTLKESISSIEAVCNIINGTKKST